MRANILVKKSGAVAGFILAGLLLPGAAVVLTAGVGRIFVRAKSDKKVIGGFAAEYKKAYKGRKVPEAAAVAEAEELLKTSLLGEFSRRYDPGLYEYYGITFKTSYIYVEKRYGTSLSALAWVTYIYPSYAR